jgi:hypothetical protein
MELVEVEVEVEDAGEVESAGAVFDLGLKKSVSFLLLEGGP